MKPQVLALCHCSGRWADAFDGVADVREVDIVNGEDVRLLPRQMGRMWGVVAEPPCTHFANSGARWWKEKGEDALLEALSILDACFRQIVLTRPDWWMIENPKGRIAHYLGRAIYKYQPHEFAALADNPTLEAYTKLTYLWGSFKMPRKHPVDKNIVDQSYIHRVSDLPTRAAERSQTPQGFARAFARAQCN